MSKNLIDKIDYTVFCVNEFARTHSVPYRQDMAGCCRSRGGTLA